jgi:hypothetical protein
MSIDSSPPRFTETQGQYLAFIYYYALVNRRPPAEADIQSFFGAPGQAGRFQRVQFPPRQGEKPLHRESSLGLMEATT